jgi:hypothetical protein
MLPVLQCHDRAIQTPLGLLDSQHIQPILARDYRPPTRLHHENDVRQGWASVAAPSATIYQAASADSDRVTFIGHGGIMNIVDVLPAQDEHAPMWVAVAYPNAQPVGWTQAHLWRPVDVMTPTARSRYAVIERRDSSLTAYENDQPVLTTSVTFNRAAQARTTTIRRHTLGTFSERRHGIAYALIDDDARVIGGAYWHNHFGSSHSEPGHAVQLTIHAARALYTFLPDGAPFHIV